MSIEDISTILDRTLNSVEKISKYTADELKDINLVMTEITSELKHHITSTEKNHIETIEILKKNKSLSDTILKKLRNIILTIIITATVIGGVWGLMQQSVKNMVRQEIDEQHPVQDHINMNDH